MDGGQPSILQPQAGSKLQEECKQASSDSLWDRIQWIVRIDFYSIFS